MAFITQICKSVAPTILRSTRNLCAVVPQSSTTLRLLHKTSFTSAVTSNDSSTNTTTNPPPSDNEPALKLSDACVKKITEICKDDNYLRVLVDGGGCSGFQYKFELDSKVNDDDVHFGPNGRVLIDTISLDYCAGATLDYSVELIKSGFRMVSNPKAEQGCSCGASFALKM